MPRNEEYTVNAYLADLLRARNPRWKEKGAVRAEQTGALAGSKGQPDLIVLSPEGSPVIIEAEYMPARNVEQEALGRLGAQASRTAREVEQAVALRFPESLKDIPQEQLEQELKRSIFTYCVHSSSEGWIDPIRWPKKGWLEGDVDALVDLIENVSVSERLIARSLDILEEGVSLAASALRARTESRPDVNRRIARELCQEDGEQTSRMAMAIIANALTFQTAIAGVHDIRTTEELRGKTGLILKGNVLGEWSRILGEVNYWPIFEVARRVLLPIPDETAAALLEILSKASSELASSGVTRSHDLSGRMFQRLIGDRKFLATFYTRPASAALLAHMAAKMLRTDWGSGRAVTDLRIADLACGTGTLLVAAYHAVIARHRRAGGDDRSIHRPMMEDALVAADIMPAAAHLTASMLSSVHPALVFSRTQVYTLPFGAPLHESGRESGRGISLGSLDLLLREHMPSLFGTGIEALEGQGPGRQGADLSLPAGSVDLAIMNPPFTAPTNHAVADIPVPSFGGFGTSAEIQGEMSRRLKQARSSLGDPASHGNAGLASNFLDLAHLKLRSGGVLALVMPLSIVQGEAWQAARDLLSRHYGEIMVVTLAGEKARDKSFSADTGMGEALIVARKRRRASASQDVFFVTLRRRPQSVAEAVEVARGIMKDPGRNPGRTRQIHVGSDPAGHVIRASLDQGGCAGVADVALAQTAMALEEGTLILPQLADSRALAAARLGDLGGSGPVHRDINGMDGGKPRGPFDLHEIPSGTVPTYPVLWAHNAQRERALVVAPDRMGTVREGMDEKAEAIWGRATRLHFNLDFRLNSQALAACWTEERTVGGTAWPNFALADPAGEKALLLWANTTLGLLLFWWEGNKQQSGRARTTITGLPSLAVLDVRSLTKRQLGKAESLFGEFSGKEFLPANEAYRDEARQALDKAVMKDLLGFADDILAPLDLLRRKWCAEPSVHGGKRTKFAE